MFIIRIACHVEFLGLKETDFDQVGTVLFEKMLGSLDGFECIRISKHGIIEGRESTSRTSASRIVVLWESSNASQHRNSINVGA